MMTKWKNVVKIMFGIVLMAFCMSMPAMAAGTGSIEFDYEEGVEGAPFAVYKVGHMDGHDGYVLSEEFAAYNISLFDKNAANTLKNYIVADDVEPFASVMTDEEGKFFLGNLEEAAYLIVGENYEYENMFYQPLPVLVSVPTESTEEEDGLSWNVVVKGKYDKDPMDDADERAFAVSKVWDDNNSENRPAAIAVQLLENGKPITGRQDGLITLNKSNNWKYIWHELDVNCEYSAIEAGVPQGYTVSISNVENGVVITNTGTTPPPNNPPSTPPMRYTGQLWWPVLVLICAGLCCFICGILVLRKTK